MSPLAPLKQNVMCSQMVRIREEKNFALAEVINQTQLLVMEPYVLSIKKGGRTGFPPLGRMLYPSPRHLLAVFYCLRSRIKNLELSTLLSSASPRNTVVSWGWK